MLRSVSNLLKNIKHLVLLGLFGMLLCVGCSQPEVLDGSQSGSVAHSSAQPNNEASNKQATVGLPQDSDGNQNSNGPASNGKAAEAEKQPSSPDDSSAKKNKGVENDTSGQVANRPCEDAQAQATTSSAKQDTQEVNTMSISAKGESPWTLRAERIKYDDNSKRARASAVIWNLLDKEGNSLMELRGDAAVVNVETQGLSFEGPVRAVGKNGETIVCQKLIWDSKARKLRGSHGVKIVRNGSTMTGKTMSASPDLKQVEIEGDVRIQFHSGQ
ncbi:MAG: LPS export ABC transporter periplasmic protein LptC [bacterium]|nr:LPS export ABC transporter periplasmic protein LptC [bacterium]